MNPGIEKTLLIKVQQINQKVNPRDDKQCTEYIESPSLAFHRKGSDEAI